MNLSTENLQTLLADYGAYRKARVEHPRLPARVVLSAIRAVDSGDEWNLTEALCGLAGGHEYSRPEESERCYCVFCGKDGDA